MDKIETVFLLRSLTAALLFAATVVMLTAVRPALACSDAVAWWDWERCLSGWRLLLFAVLLAALWGLCFHYLFPRVYLALNRKTPLWPREAFWRSLAWFYLLSWASFVVIFDWLSDELGQISAGIFRGSVPWLSQHGLSMLLLSGAGVLAVFLARIGRRCRHGRSTLR